MKKVLVVNQGNTDNIGDQAILYTINNIIGKNDFNVTFAGFVNVRENNIINNQNLNYLNFINKFIKEHMVNFKKIIKRLLWLKKEAKYIDNILRNNEFEHVIIGGGQLLLSNDIFPIALYCWSKKVKINQPNAKIHIYSVGIGERFSIDELFLLKKAIKNIDSFFVRDDFSKERLKKISGLHSDRIKVVYDVVHSISDYYSGKCQENKSTYFPIAYNVLTRYNYLEINRQEYFNLLQGEIIKDYRNGFKVCISYTCIEDYKTVCDLKKYLQAQNNIDIEIVDLGKLDDLIDLISSSKKVISARMHPLIIASSYKVDAKPIIISEKLSSYDKIIKDKNFNILALKCEIENSLIMLLNS